MVRFALACAVVLGCGGRGAATVDAPSATDAPPVSDATGAILVPPPNAGADYQLGGAYPLPAGVTVV